jgi:SAM-dependent methyltransferase
MALLRGLLLRAFGRPQGLLGRLGGVMMAHGNRDCAAWVVDRLGIEGQDTVLEVGFGPGVGISLATAAAAGGRVAGIDPSPEMLVQAKARNAEAIGRGRVDLREAERHAAGAAEDAADFVQPSPGVRPHLHRVDGEDLVEAVVGKRQRLHRSEMHRPRARRRTGSSTP